MATVGTTEVLYIGGVGRSGSTLLAYLLGQMNDYVVAGELKFVWQNGVKDNELCGCGVRFSECPFWRSVGDVAFGGWHAVDVEDVLRLQSRVTSRWSAAALLAGFGRRSDFVKLASFLQPLYHAIASVSGARIVVDTSKTPVEALVISRLPGFTCRVIHLVRDSRGVAFSWAKRGIRLPQIVGREAMMLDYQPRYMAPRWLYGNLFFEILRATIPTARLRYEDLVRAPRAEVARALARCGTLPNGDETAIPLTGAVRLGTLHTIGGNPMRFRQGQAPIHEDDAWKRDMPPRARREVTLVTWPLLLRYGYLPANRGSIVARSR
jgi:hypothetical protein